MKSSSGGGTTQPPRNSIVALVANALHYLNHFMVGGIVVLGNGCVEESGDFQELSSELFC